MPGPFSQTGTIQSDTFLAEIRVRLKEAIKLIEGGKSSIIIVTAFYCGTVPDECIEHHCCIHKSIIGCLSTSHIGKCLVLRGRDRTFSNQDARTVPAVRAMTINRDIAIGAGNRDALFLFIPLEFQSLHTEKIF